MNSKQAKIVAAVFTDPASPSIVWDDVESLPLAVGCKLIEGRGSRIRFECRGIIVAFHRPYPTKEAKLYQIRDARKYLEQLGVKP